MFCEKCGTELPEGSRFCMNCGAKAADEEAVRETAAQEAAISVDSPVMEAGSAVIEEIADIPEAKTSLVQDVPEPEKVQENKAQAPTQQIRPTPEQPITAQAAQPKQAPIQQAVPRPAPKPQATVQMTAGMSAQTQQAIPVQAATAAQQADTAPKPEKIKPLQTWKFIGMFIITAIPVLSLIMVLVWSFGGGFNKNTKSFARAILILWIAGLILLIVTAIVNWALIQYIWTSFSALPTGITP